MEIIKCELCNAEWNPDEHGLPCKLAGLNVCESCHDDWYGCAGDIGESNPKEISEILKGAQFGDDLLRKQIAKLWAQVDKQGHTPGITCRATVNPDNPRWKRFECRPGVEYHNTMDEWMYCPHCGKTLETE